VKKVLDQILLGMFHRMCSKGINACHTLALMAVTDGALSEWAMECSTQSNPKTCTDNPLALMLKRIQSDPQTCPRCGTTMLRSGGTDTCHNCGEEV
jgi:hypothetical protein